MRVRLGSWRCPSGNSVEVFLRGGTGAALRHLDLEWDSPPPLTPADERYYQAVVLPKLTCRLQEFLQRPGRAVVIVA